MFGNSLVGLKDIDVEIGLETWCMTEPGEANGLSRYVQRIQRFFSATCESCQNC